MMVFDSSHYEFTYDYLGRLHRFRARGIMEPCTTITRAVPRSQFIVYVNLKSPPRPRNCSKLFTAAPTDRKGVHAAAIHHCLATPFSQCHARWHFLSNSHTVPLPLASQMILVPGRTQMYSIGHHWSRPRYSMGFRKIASDQYPCQPPTAF
jgi:hypothetical protein